MKKVLNETEQLNEVLKAKRGRPKKVTVTKIGFTDLAVASYLSLYFPIVELNNINGVKFEFIFNDSPELQKLLSLFYLNKALVNPIEYFNAIKNVKQRLYAGR